MLASEPHSASCDSQFKSCWIKSAPGMPAELGSACTWATTTAHDIGSTSSPAGASAPAGLAGHWATWPDRAKRVADALFHRFLRELLGVSRLAGTGPSPGRRREGRGGVCGRALGLRDRS